MTPIDRADTGGTSQTPGSEWRPISRVRTYELVLDRIEEQILSGQLKVGDRLPPERDLAAMLGVSRAAVREATRTLQAQGVVRSGVGTGPDSGTLVAAQSSQALTRLLRLHVALASFPLGDLVEARTMLERWSVALAARNASPAQLARLADLVTAMDRPGITAAEFNDLDTEFHVMIADAGGNRLARDITSAIRESVRHRLLAAFQQLDDWESAVGRLRAEHHQILELITARRSEAAADAVERHIHDFFAGIPEP